MSLHGRLHADPALLALGNLVFACSRYCHCVNTVAPHTPDTCCKTCSAGTLRTGAVAHVFKADDRALSLMLVSL